MATAPIENELVGLIKAIRGWIAQGLRTEEIQARISDPAGVGHKLIARAVERRQAGQHYLRGTAPAVIVEVEPDDEDLEPSRTGD